MPIIGHIQTVLVTRGIGGGTGIPACASSFAVAYYADLTSPSSDKVDDLIGVRADSVYYGQSISGGTINFYRSSGSFDYIDGTGAEVSGIAIPPTGLYVVTESISEITTSDGSYYPVCERAGTVLHDVNQGIHISVDTPIWTEILWGTDWLNQIGYADQQNYIDNGFIWQSGVNGSWVALDPNTLVPLKVLMDVSTRMPITEMPVILLPYALSTPL